MKKILIFFVVVIAILSSIWYLNKEKKIANQQKKIYNKEFENIFNKDIRGTEFASLINKALDLNDKAGVKKNDDEIYVNNNENSIQIEIKFKDSEKLFQAEKIQKNGMGKFIELYGNSNFRLTKLEYHKKTKTIKYAYFEEI